ncbi:MAG TPA: hypothetical protein P5517_06865 [Candidatus Saccharicenans sp.]|nr:hypothetical protein [Candidatus Saccharicenans sp.]
MIERKGRKKKLRLRSLLLILEGSSLLEVTIAMGLVFFLLTGLAQMLASSLLIKQKADYHRLAADIISNELEQLKGAGLDTPELSRGFHQKPVEEPNSGRRFLLTWEVIEISKNLKKIYLSLSPADVSQRLPEVRATLYFSHHLNF